MARKRIAANELNHDNWDEDYEPEEAGTFKKAPSSVLEGRVIRTAKRRNPIPSASNEETPKNVFSNFGGFAKPAASSASPFAFLSKLTDTQSNKTNGVSITSSVVTKPSETTMNNKSEKSAEYYSKLKGLNEGVAEWIKTHVDKNPLCILTPIFKDYEKYFAEIEDAEKSDKVVKSTSIFSNDVKTTPVTVSSSLPVFGNSVSKPNEGTKSNSEDSPLSTTASTSPVITKPTFSFGTLPTATTSTTGFSFGTGKPFTFSNVSKPETPDNSSVNDAEDNDEPPKVEFKRVIEDGSIFSQRCKVFVKKDGQFSDRGVGTLFLKPVAGSEKIQLIVRADTNLGNLLLNFILSESIPMQRMAKNNVMLVSIPTPDSKPPPTPILLRVKTSEEADELLKILEKHKK